MGFLALSLNTIFSPFVLRLVIDYFRHGSIFSYIVVEIVWLCKLFCLIKPYMLIVISSPFASLVINWILSRLDGQSNYRLGPGRVNLRFWVVRWHVTPLHSAQFQNSYSILVNPGVTQFCHEIKAIMAFSFLTWILRNTLASSVRAYMPLTV